MLEIVVVWRLAVQIGRSATNKGLPKLRYQIMAILLWIIGEVLGGIIANLFITSHDFWLTYFIALIGAVSGAGIAFLIVHWLPNQQTDAIAAPLTPGAPAKKSFWASVWVPTCIVFLAIGCLLLGFGASFVVQMRSQIIEMRGKNPVIGTQLAYGSIVASPTGLIPANASKVHFGFECGEGINEKTDITVDWYVNNQLAFSTKGKVEGGYFISELDTRIMAFPKGEHSVKARFGALDLASKTFTVK